MITSDSNKKRGLGLAQAFHTLSILPLPGPDAKCEATQLYFYPFVGLVISSIFALVLNYVPFCQKAQSNLPLSLVLGFLWPSWMAFITRGFHLDGLADTADGFGGGWTVERRLEIMKDSRSGSFGVIAIVLCLMLKAIFASVIIYQGLSFVLIWTCIVSRTLVVFTCSVSKYAKPQGLSYNLVSYAKATHSVFVFAFTASCGFCFAYCFDVTLKTLLGSFLLPFINCLGLLLLSNKKIGGVTGDVLGAMCEVCEVASLFGAAVLLF